MSLSLEQMDGSSLPAALPGQFLVLRLHTNPEGPPILRNYSLSGPPGAATYRVSIKLEVNGAASTYVHNHVNAGEVLEVSAPRGAFTLRSGDGPVVLVSAGIGATPVLAMLYALAGAASSREVWWLHGARSRREHSFAKESRGLVRKLARGQSHVVYSKPEPEDQLGVDYDSSGHLTIGLLDQLGVTRNSDFYLCGPPSFLGDFDAGSASMGR